MDGVEGRLRLTVITIGGALAAILLADVASRLTPQAGARLQAVETVDGLILKRSSAEFVRQWEVAERIQHCLGDVRRELIGR